MQNNQNENIQDAKSNEQGSSTEERTEDVVSRQDFDKVIAELKELRTDRAKEREEKEALLKQLNGEEKPEEKKDLSVAEAVAAELAKRDEQARSETRKQNLSKAIEDFKKSNPSFAGDDDKFKVIENELNNFNLSNVDSVEGFSKMLNKAAVLTGVNSNTEEPVESKTPSYTPTPGGSSIANSAPSDEVRLTDGEAAIARANGVTEEQALKLKKNQPKTFAAIMGS